MKIDQEWIYQGLQDKKKSEKDIYRKARSLGIINEDAHNRLFSLYEDRNRVVHRFIISEITFAEIESIAFKYYQIRDEINHIIFKIEKEQIKQGIGMTTVSKNDDGKASIKKWVDEKLGKLDYFEDQTRKT